MEDGTILRNNYRLERLLGRGGMAEVYLAFDLRRQAYVAIKILREDLAEDPEFVRRFAREAEALAHLEHPNIVRFYSFERQGATAFIVMDYVQGTTLQRRLAEVEGAIPLDVVTGIVQKVGAALQYAHSQGYVHRDIKPGNIMLREDGTPLLSDFGIARAAESATLTTLQVGTPAYMSPEQILGRELTTRSDIYSMGVVLYEMVAGRRPFTGDEPGVTGTSTRARLRDAHLNISPADPRTFNPKLPTLLAGVILRALAKNPDERWPDMTSLIQAWLATTDSAERPPRTAPWGAALPATARDGQPTAETLRPREASSPTGPVTPAHPTTPAGAPAPTHGVSSGLLWGILGAIGVLVLVIAVLVWRMLATWPPQTAQGGTPAGPTADAAAIAQTVLASESTATAEVIAIIGTSVVEQVEVVIVTEMQPPTASASTPTSVKTAATPTSAIQQATSVPMADAAATRIAAHAATAVAQAQEAANATATAEKSPASTPTATATATAKPQPVRRAVLAFTVTERFREVYKIFVINSDGTGKRQLVDLASEPSFSPDGKQLVFFAWPGGLDIMNLDGGGRHQVVPDGEAAFPSWSPNGQWIAFHSVRGSSSRFDIYVVRSSGTEERMLVDGEQATWSPDSKRLAYKGCMGSDCGLMIVNLDGSGKRRLTDSANDGNPDWSRDVNRIVFTSERDGNHEIYVVNPDGSGLKRLTNSPGPDAMPVWLPGGQQIAFRSARSGSWGIWIMNADGSGVRKLTDAAVDPNRWIWEKMAAAIR